MTAAWNFALTLPREKAPRTIIDVGANQSQMIRLLSLHCPQAPRVISFEPNPECKPLGEVFGVGLSDHSGEASFYVPAGDDAIGSLSKPASSASSAKEMKIQLGRFDTMIEQGKIPWSELNRPVLIKIDTEGNELPVLLGMGKYLSEVDYLLLEINNTEDRVGDFDALAIQKLLLDAGFNRSKVLYACYDGPWSPAYMDTLYWRKAK